MNKQQELFERFKDLEYRLRYLSAFIQNDFETCGNPSFDDFSMFCAEADSVEDEIKDLLDITCEFIEENMEKQK